MSDMIQQGVHGCSEEASYVQPASPLVRERLEWFKDQKLALMMHYGPYSQIGMDASWSRKNVDWEDDSEAYRKQYTELYKTFNPIRFQLSEVVARAREIQPWLITADRCVGGENENYITPEQSIPDRVIRVPWESCVTVGTQWGFRFGDTYKSTRTLVKMLIQVVSHGGNLALNIGPQPDGELPPPPCGSLQAWARG